MDFFKRKVTNGNLSLDSTTLVLLKPNDEITREPLRGVKLGTFWLEDMQRVFMIS
ncbi:hypothetical protein SK128_002142 [Halocaridina rubra]|uniref:Uncharacterized protein n=1 Tax=Halocaridina rubra TaxID=373956 RepID=A0AAN8ZXA3_HALRR